MQNWMLLFTFSVLNGNHHFWTNLVQRINIVSLTLNLAPRLIKNLNMQNSVMVFTFSVLDRKHSFGANLFQKLNIISLSGNLVPRPIWICRIYWKCYCFCFRPETLFWGNFEKTKSKLSVSAEVWHKD